MTGRRVEHARIAKRRGGGRRLLRGIARVLSWALVLAGVFVLGIGYGRIASRDDETRRDTVSIERDALEVEATLPPRTETVTKTVTVRARPRPASRPTDRNQ